MSEGEPNRSGRPLKFKSVKELNDRIQAYFDGCRDHDGEWKRPVLITGLALALDTSRQTLLNYQEKEEYFDTIMRAKLVCESYAEEQLFVGRNPSGAQFSLKNFGWEDRSEMKHTYDPKQIEDEDRAILSRFVKPSEDA